MSPAVIAAIVAAVVAVVTLLGNWGINATYYGRLIERVDTNTREIAWIRPKVEQHDTDIAVLKKVTE